MTDRESNNEDVITAVLAVFAERDMNLLNGDKLEQSFPAALEALGEKVEFFDGVIYPIYPELRNIIYRMESFGFCYWVSPYFKNLQLTMVPRVTERILSERIDRDIITKAAEAWMECYRNGRCETKTEKISRD